MRDNRLGAAYAKAKTFIGTREISGDEDNPVIVEWAKTIGHSWVREDSTAWCASFLGAMLESQGLKSTRKLNARSYVDWGDPVGIEDAKPGDIVVFWRESKASWKGHAGFYVSHGNTWVNVLGGNQSDMVKVSQYRRDHLLAVRTLRTDAPQPSHTPWQWILDAIQSILGKLK